MSNERTNETDGLGDRTPRSLDEREASIRKSDSYVPPEVLPVPNPIDGYGFRYIRTALNGKQDVKNISMKFREKWIPCKAVDHPEIVAMSDIDMRPEFEGNIEIGGLMLCKAPLEFIRQRDEYYARKAGAQMEGLDRHFLQQSDPRMPLDRPDRKTRTSFSDGG